MISNLLNAPAKSHADGWQVTFIGLAAMAVTADRRQTLGIRSLGSCLGVALYDPRRRLAGMVHCMLPQASTVPALSKRNLFLFVDTGTQALIDAMLNEGADRSRLIAKAAGGASLIEENGVFQIGQRNARALEEILWKNNLRIDASDFGGADARSLAMDVASGEVTVSRAGRELRL